MTTPPKKITLAHVRELMYSAVLCDALDSIGRTRQSPRVPLQPLTSDVMIVGRCRTTLWADMFHEDSRPYDLELKAVDRCQSDDVFVAAAGGSMRSGIWGELLTTAVRNGGCVGAIVDGAIRDAGKIREMNFPVVARVAAFTTARTANAWSISTCRLRLMAWSFTPAIWSSRMRTGSSLYPRRSKQMCSLWRGRKSMTKTRCEMRSKAA